MESKKTKILQGKFKNTKSPQSMAISKAQIHKPVMKAHVAAYLYIQPQINTN